MIFLLDNSELSDVYGGITRRPEFDKEVNRGYKIAIAVAAVSTAFNTIAGLIFLRGPISVENDLNKAFRWRVINSNIALRNIRIASAILGGVCGAIAVFI